MTSRRKHTPTRRRCVRCGQLWDELTGRYCFDCEHQVELPLGTVELVRKPRARRPTPRRRAG
jgi:hypothetical protein